MIQKWKIKALVQKTISFLPFHRNLNYLFQKYVTGGIELSDQYWGYKITHARDHINFYSEYETNRLKGKTVLELGTGWYPIVPLCLFLSNAEKIISIDIQSWMTKAYQLKAIKKIIDFRENGELEKYLPVIDENRWDVLKQIIKDSRNLNKNDINNLICLESIVTDARKTGLKENSIDFICSNNTFEHINKNILFGILSEFKRIIRKDGIMSHFIDMSDHFSHYDTSITNYNFLRFSNFAWKLIDNNIQPQNRLRFIDYKRMYEKAGIPVSKELITGSQPGELKKVIISEDFKNYPDYELVITHAYIISKMFKE
jgi:hypothetical protein